MKDLQPYAGDLDKYLFSLLELLRTKYYNVSVNRGKNTHIFYYRLKYGDWMLKGGLEKDLKKQSVSIPNGELLGYYMNSEIPKEILELL